MWKKKLNIHRETIETQLINKSEIDYKRSVLTENPRRILQFFTRSIIHFFFFMESSRVNRIPLLYIYYNIIIQCHKSVFPEFGLNVITVNYYESLRRAYFYHYFSFYPGKKK